jgi:hypothetical protein
MHTTHQDSYSTSAVTGLVNYYRYIGEYGDTMGELSPLGVSRQNELASTGSQWYGGTYGMVCTSCFNKQPVSSVLGF